MTSHGEAEIDYCGCCGNECNGAMADIIVYEWCVRCIDHIGSAGPAWERTYESVTGEPCPFQVDPS